MAGRAAPWLAAWLCACAAGGPSESFCQLGQEHELSRSVAKDFDAIDLVAVGERAIALWSVPGGLFGKLLSRDGVAIGPSVRLGVRCEGGLDALVDGAEVEIACLLHPRHGKQDEPGGVLLHRVDARLHVQRTQLLGGAGAQSEGVALARGARGIELAWHDGSPDAHRVWWASLAEDAAAPRAVSELGRMAQAPSMAVRGGQVVLVWAENWIDAGELASRLVYWQRGGAPRTLLPRAHVAAMPQLLALGAELVLGYRDRTRSTAKTGLYLSALEPLRGMTALAARPSVRAGRADGVGRPALCACMRGVVAATPRTYGGDYFVGVNWLDGELHRMRGEQQFYEDSHAFTQVAVACLGTQALLLIAEFPQLQRETTVLRAVPYRCR